MFIELVFLLDIYHEDSDGDGAAKQQPDAADGGDGRLVAPDSEPRGGQPVGRVARRKGRGFRVHFPGRIRRMRRMRRMRRSRQDEAG